MNAKSDTKEEEEYNLKYKNKRIDNKWIQLS
jgi:hypothetical protein